MTHKEKKIADVGEFKYLDDVCSGDMLLASVMIDGRLRTGDDKPKFLAWSCITDVFYHQNIKRGKNPEDVLYCELTEYLNQLQTTYHRLYCHEPLTIVSIENKSDSYGAWHVFTIERGRVQFDNQLYFVLHKKV